MGLRRVLPCRKVFMKDPSSSSSIISPKPGNTNTTSNRKVMTSTLRMVFQRKEPSHGGDIDLHTLAYISHLSSGHRVGTCF